MSEDPQLRIDILEKITSHIIVYLNICSQGRKNRHEDCALSLKYVVFLAYIACKYPAANQIGIHG